MANPTTNLSMTKPTVGGSTDTWGTTLNEEVVDVIDAVFSVTGTDVSMSDITFNSVALQETGSGTDTVKVQAPSAVTTSYTLTMPGAVGASGQILRTSDASGTLEWVTDEEGDLKSVADATNGGLDVTNGTGPDVTLAVDFNDLAAAVVDVAADSIGILDATDNDTKKETIADLVSAMGGTGLTGASGQLSVDAAQTQITSVGALDAGSITSGFGAIDNGSSAITTTGTVSATTLAGTLSTATQNSVTTATGLVTVGALNSGSIASGFGNINVGSSSITGGAGSFTTISGSTSLALATGATVTGIDNGALGSSATLLATQGAIKTYIDAQVGSFDTLAEVLANGNTTGSTNIIVSASQKITTDTIDETTAGDGVTIDSVLVKDNTVTATTFTGALVGNASTATTAATVTGATQAAITSAANLATVGTIGTGVWNGTAISGDYIDVTTSPLANTKIWIGDSSGDAQEFALSGDVTMTAGGAVTVADNAITLAKLEDGTQGDVLYYGASGAPARLGAGSDGDVLTSGGAGANPTWETPTTGDITGVTAGTNLNGGGTGGDVTLNLDASISLTAVTATTLTGTLSTAAQTNLTSLGTLTSLNLSGNLDLQDDDKILLGTGDDLEIYHDGSNSYIAEGGTGDLYITSSVIRPRTDQLTLNNAANSATMLEAVAAGAVTLYHNGSAKLATASGGVDITGNIVASGTGPSAIGGSADSNVALALTGAFGPVAGDANMGVFINHAITGTPNENIEAVRISPNITEAGSGTHTSILGVSIGTLSVTGAGASTGNTANLYIGPPATVGSTRNHQLWMYQGDSSQSADSTFDNLVIENSGSAGISILTGASDSGGILFGDSGDNGRGKLYYDHNTDKMNVAAGGSIAMTLDGSQDVNIPNGGLMIGSTSSATAPLTVHADTGTSVDSVVRLRCTNSTPKTTQIQFETYNGATSDGIIYFDHSSGVAASSFIGMGVAGTSKGSFKTYGNSAENTLVVQNSRVGISTTSPAAKLDIQGWSSGAGIDLNYGNATGTVQGFSLMANSVVCGSIGMEMRQSPDEGDLCFFGGAQASPVLRITNDGDVAIGSSIDPNCRFNVRHPSGALISRLEGYTNSYSSKLLISSSSSGDGGMMYDPADNTMDIFSYGDLTFNVGTSNTGGTVGNPRMVIDQDGDVGIGVTSVGNRLQVDRTGSSAHWLSKFSNNYDSSNDVAIQMCYANSSGINSGMSIEMDYATGTSEYILLCSSGGTQRFRVNPNGLVHVAGELTAGTKTFRIDHPLAEKKASHDLVHSCLEGPRADLIYRGQVDLSAGYAQVDLDDAAGMTEGTWELLCRDPQCWIQNDTGWSAVRGDVEGNTLTIECESTDSDDTVSWMVCAERQDESIKEQRTTDDDGHIIVEPEKEEEE